MTSCPLRWKGIPSHFWDLLVQVIGTRGEIMSDRLNFRLPRPKMLKVDRWHANLWPPPQNYIYLLSSIQYFKLVLVSFLSKQNNNKKCIVLLRFFALRLFFFFPLFTHWCLCKIFVLIASFVLEIVTGRMINLFKTQPCLLLLQV